MPGTPTTHYQLPTYAPNDPPDLEGAYNEAMMKIDEQMEANEQMATDALAEAAAATEKANVLQTDLETLQTQLTTLSGKVDAIEESGSFAPADTDAIADVSKIAQAKVTSAGIVYFKQAEVEDEPNA